ncbi:MULTISPECIES: hypothetical protein [Methanocalculus]|uniref:hypothetical protein n=1 Tax=Methanocalculus TaxID=71151 RepID=UPI0020A0AA0A|nr:MULTISPECIES: hypothetical protein [unclassified Methanocalculus]MCP1662208.1 hypothetical protein [Methanocalculus sp. AMF5]
MSQEAIAKIFAEQGIGKEIQCDAAFQISEKHGIDKLEIAKYCNKNGIKIRGCQLGCFK